MAVQILIHRDGGKVVFDSPSNIQQSDLVFWRNDDSAAHYPIPGCGSLKVAPGKTTQASPYQGFPDTTSQLPLTVNYICALHGEQGSMLISADTPASPPAGAPAIDPQNVPIHIRRSGGKVTFDTVDVAQGDSVYWINDDSQEHWPVPNCTGLLVQPNQSSNPVQPATSNAPRSPYTSPALPTTGPSPLPMAIAYGCAIAGHENESGTLNIYDNLAPVLAVGGAGAPTIAQQGIPITIVTGGKSPYAIVQDSANPHLQQIEQPPAGSSGGVAVVLTQSATNGTINLQVNVTDALGKNLTQSVPVVIALS